MTSVTSESLEPSRPGRTALLLLAVCFVLNMAVRGVQEVFPVFLLPISDAFGAGRAETTSVIALSFLVLGLSGPVIGWLFDRWGPFRLFLLSLLLTAVAAMLASRATTLWQLHITLGAMIGFGVGCVGFVPIAALLSKWFRARLSSAMATAHSANGIGLLWMSPLAQYLIDWQGWRTAYLTLGLSLLALLPVLFLLNWRWVRRGHPDYRTGDRGTDAEPRPAGNAPTFRDALRHPAFWGIGWAFLFTSIGMYMISVQTPAYLVHVGYSRQDAAEAFGLVGLLLPVGLIGFGWLADRVGRSRTIRLTYLLSLCGLTCLMLLSEGPALWLLGLFILLFGGTFGARGPIVSTIAAVNFRGPDFGRIFGTITMGMGFGVAIGAWASGFLYDLTGDYRIIIAAAMAALVLAASVFVFVRPMARA